MPNPRPVAAALAAALVAVVLTPLAAWSAPTGTALAGTAPAGTAPAGTAPTGTAPAGPSADPGAHADLPAYEHPAPAPVEPDQVLVRFAPSASRSAQGSSLSAAGATGTGVPVPGTRYVAVPVGDEDTEAVAARLAADPRVAAVEVDHVRHASGGTDDPLLRDLSGALEAIRLPRAWEASTGEGVVVAVLDSGVDTTHEDLVARMLPGTDLVDGDDDPADPKGHGTLVAGSIAATGDNGTGGVGVAYDASVLPVRVLDTLLTTTDSRAAAGIAWAVAHGADVVNLSFGAPEPSGVLLDAIRSAVAAGVVVVAAAGNTGDQVPQYPAAYAPDVDGLLSVSATNDAGALTGWASWGDTVSVAAPGTLVVGPRPGGGYQWGWGSSFAAPLVSGAAALVLAGTPGLAPAAVEQRLVSTARDAGPRGYDPYYGAGLLDVAAAATATSTVHAAAGVPLDRAPADPGPSDDTAATAQPLVGGTTTATLSPEGDVDWYAVDVQAGTYQVEAGYTVPASSGIEQILDPRLEVRDAAGLVLATANAESGGSPERVQVQVAAAGTIRVGVSNVNGSAPLPVYRYRLTVERASSDAATTPPTRSWWTSATPAPHTSGVEARPTVRVGFARDLRTSDLTAAHVRLRDEAGAAVSATVGWDAPGRTVTVTPTSDLSPGHHYSLVVAGVRDTAGETLPTPVRVPFTVGAGGDRYTAVEPFRLVDTRQPAPDDTFGPVVSGRRLVVSLAGLLPPDATAVVVSLASTRHDAVGNVRVFPVAADGSGPAPRVANLNVVPGVDQPNLATVQLGPGQTIAAMPEGPLTDLVLDVFGYYSPGGASGYVPVTPVRVLDTRDGTGAPVGPVTGGHWVDLAAAGAHGVPADATAVVLNVAGTGVRGGTFVSVLPTPDLGVAWTGPTTSNLNLYPGRDQANLVTVKVGEDGRVRFWVDRSATHLVADLAGYYSPSGRDGLVPVAPTRVADTRSALGFAGILRAGVPADVRIGGTSAVPAQATAAVVNLAGVQPASGTHVRAFPTTVPATLPDVASINLVPGRDESNMAVLTLGAEGRSTFYARSADVHVVVDVFGWFRTYR
ncbi:S8 family serine peptidase [Cellulomonas sp. H30R-01]|uniref:S8 family serine peptidase n=1 Tax=Cellulomonas sp. H30R-01 TaxID=2704467 RepID=UPI00138D2670|nr:S8 family serine peptidase [Cellulomonas sp. H30R-01]QHT57760.1 S8 family serine peptidase [Cellulomonas sp. H30R-01]